MDNGNLYRTSVGLLGKKSNWTWLLEVQKSFNQKLLVEKIIYKTKKFSFATHTEHCLNSFKLKNLDLQMSYKFSDKLTAFFLHKNLSKESPRIGKCFLQFFS